WFGAVILIARSAAARLVTGPVNLTITGWATPTTAPLAGSIDATVNDDVGGAMAAVAGAAAATTVSAAIDPASQPLRIVLPTVSTPPRRREPPARTASPYYALCSAQQTKHTLRTSQW